VNLTPDEACHIGDPRGKIGKTWERNVWLILDRKKAADYQCANKVDTERLHSASNLPPC
jgi:hypothetical protein